MMTMMINRYHPLNQLHEQYGEKKTEKSSSFFLYSLFFLFAVLVVCVSFFFFLCIRPYCFFLFRLFCDDKIQCYSVQETSLIDLFFLTSFRSISSIMTEWREFRPDKQLLQNNFDGYRLSLEPLAQYSLKFDENLQVQKDIQLDQEFYTYNGIKAFKSSNQLYLNPWKDTSDAYFFDQFHSIQQMNLSSNESLSHLQQPINVYQLPKTTLNGSMIFITESMVVVGDGRSRLFILNSTNPKWKLLHEQDFDELINSPSRLLHAVYHQGTLHVLMGFIQKDCQLLWTSFSVGTANEIQLTRRRILNGKKWPDFYAFESNGQGIYITSEGLYKFTFDSLIEVKPEEPPKQPTLEKIESSLHYIWSQTHTTIDIEIDLTENTESQPCSVDIQVDHLKCSLNDTILVDAKLFDTIDPKESSYVITKDKNNQLTITLQKANVGSFWSEVFREGQAISGGIKMDNLPETNVDEDEDEMKQPYNNQQLEECDQYSNETDTFLVRIDGDTHRITHQALVNNQILFTQLNPPLLCIRNDVSNAKMFDEN